MSLDCSLQNVQSRSTASQDHSELLLTECTFTKDSGSGLLFQVCIFGQVYVFGLILTECTYAKDSVSGLLFQVCKFGKGAVSGLLLTECTFAKDRVSGLLFQVYIFGKELSLDCSLQNVHSRRTASQNYSGLLLTECTFAKDSVSGLLFQVCMFGQVYVFGLILTECTYAKDSVSALLECLHTGLDHELCIGIRGLEYCITARASGVPRIPVMQLVQHGNTKVSAVSYCIQYAFL